MHSDHFPIMCFGVTVLHLRSNMLHFKSVLLCFLFVLYLYLYSYFFFCILCNALVRPSGSVQVQFGADSQCNASCSAPLCFTRRSPGENAELHPAREITASALDHSMMSRCQAYCWKGDICTVIFERYYGKCPQSAIILQCRSKNIRNALKDIDIWFMTHALLPISLFVWERCLLASGNRGRRE